MAQIKLYTTSLCSDCRAAKRSLNEENISYEEINIEDVDRAAADTVMQANWGDARYQPLISVGSS